MRYYEILYIVNPNFERKKLDETMKEIDNRLTETKSSDLVIRHMIVRIEKEPDVLEKVDNESSIKEKEDLKSDKDKSSDDVKDKISKEKNDEETEGVE